MTNEKDKSTVEAEIRKVMDRFTDAVSDKDLNGVMCLCSPDLVWFDFIAPLHHVGAYAYRKVWEQFCEWDEAPTVITHEHLSMPFDLETNKALRDLNQE